MKIYTESLISESHGVKVYEEFVNEGFADKLAASKSKKNANAPVSDKKSADDHEDNKKGGFSEKLAAAKSKKSEPGTGVVSSKTNDASVASEPNKKDSSKKGGFSEKLAAAKSKKDEPAKDSQDEKADAPAPEENSSVKKDVKVSDFAKRYAQKKGISVQDYYNQKKITAQKSVESQALSKFKDNLAKRRNKTYITGGGSENSKPMQYVYNKESLQDEIIYAITGNLNFNSDLNYINVTKVEDFSYLFSEYYGGDSLKTQLLRQFDGDISGWNTYNAKTTKGMFAYSLYSGSSGDIMDFDMTSNEDASEMFYMSAYAGTAPSKWEFKPGALIDKMFTGAKNFEGSCMDSFDPSNVNVASLDPFMTFLGCKSYPSWISSIKIPMKSKEEIQDRLIEYKECLDDMDEDYKMIKTLNHFDVSGVSDFSNLFCRFYKNEKSIHNDKTKPTDEESRFLSTLNPDISDWDMHNASDTSRMFAFGCFNGDVSKWEFSSNWKNAYGMFYFCSSFTGKNLSGTADSVFNTESLENMSMMFFNCRNFRCDCSEMPVPSCIDFENEKTFSGNFVNVLPKGYNHEFTPKWYMDIYNRMLEKM